VADNDIDQAPDVVDLQPHDTLMDVNPSSLLLNVRLQCHDFSSEHSLCIENLGILVLQLIEFDLHGSELISTAIVDAEEFITVGSLLTCVTGLRRLNLRYISVVGLCDVRIWGRKD